MVRERMDSMAASQVYGLLYKSLTMLQRIQHPLIIARALVFWAIRRVACKVECVALPKLSTEPRRMLRLRTDSLSVPSTQTVSVETA